MITDAERDALRQGTFSLDSLNCTITSNDSAAPSAYHGSITITQGPDGALTFKMFAPDAQTAFHAGHWTAGTLLADKDYYSLIAGDLQGRTWEARYLIPNVSMGVGGRGCVLTGMIHELTMHDQSPIPRSDSAFDIEFFQPIDLPANSNTHTEQRLGRISVRSSKVDLGVVDSVGFHFEFHLGELSTRLRASAKGDQIVPHMDMRIIEALQFASGHTVLPAIIVIRQGNQEQLRIVSSGLKSVAVKGLPPTPRHTANSNGPAWDLFAKYLEYIATFGKEQFHPLSVIWDGVLKAHAASIDTQVLVFSVAVEAMLGTIEVSNANPARRQEMLDEITACNAAIEELLEGRSPAPEVTRRYRGLLASMLTPRPIDRLHDLAASNRINKALIGPWKRLRNSSAHGMSVPGGRIDGIVRDKDAVLTLMHQLTFHMLGYLGPFQDYASSGWPTVNYPPT